MDRVAIFYCLLLLSPACTAAEESDTWDTVTEFAWCWGLPMAAGVGAVAAAPVALAAAGFGAGGIAAGSLAAKAMSFAATKGVGMAVVSAGQAAGAAGIGGVANAAIGTVGAGITWLFAGCSGPSCDDDKK